MHDRIDARLEKIDVYYDAAAPDVREQADEIIPWGEIYRLNDDDQYLRFVREHVEEAYRRRARGDRTTPLCRCADRACPIKRGSLPPQVVPRRGGLDELEQGVEARVDAFVNGDHPDVVVGEALEKWLDRHAEILPALTRAVSKLEADVESSRGLLDV
jgi:hypothetical protein